MSKSPEGDRCFPGGHAKCSGTRGTRRGIPKEVLDGAVSHIQLREAGLGPGAGRVSDLRAGTACLDERTGEIAAGGAISRDQPRRGSAPRAGTPAARVEPGHDGIGGVPRVSGGRGGRDGQDATTAPDAGSRRQGTGVFAQRPGARNLLHTTVLSLARTAAGVWAGGGISQQELKPRFTTSPAGLVGLDRML